MKENKDLWIIGGILAVLLVLGLCTCVVCLAGTLMAVNITPGGPSTPPPYLEPIYPDEDPTTPPPPPTLEPPPDEVEETMEALEAAVIPDSDLHELGIRFLGVPATTPRTLDQENPDYPVGTRRLFNVSNVDTDQQFDIDAVLAYKTAHVYMWVEEGVSFDEDRLKEAADLFETHTYPTNREFFGSEWTPGIDNDPHLSILHARNLGFTVAGYFSSPDAYVKAVREDSNEMEMFYINIENVTLGNDFYNGVLAHEFQHMIHWNNDRNEATWLNEGCSELAMELNNRSHPDGPGLYDVGGSEGAYLRRPDTQLTTWPEGTAGDASANYGAAYLFVSYFLERFGEDATKALVSDEENGMDSVDDVLRELNLDVAGHEALFADWTVANLLDDTSIAEGQYGYETINLFDPAIDESYRANAYPVDARSTVRQYGVDYIEVQSKTPLEFTFRGSTLTSLMDTQANSGQYLWWSNREDESDARLTRVVDLSGATEAELEFWSWHHIEEDWDYAYVLVGTGAGDSLPADLNSTDITWRILDDRALNCTSTNPNGNNFGCGITGKSEGWEQLSADLGDYAGQEIALRFEYITDAAVNQSGFAIDDVQVTADGVALFEDDLESEDDAWFAEGFVRHANVLEQQWIVQLITFGDEVEVTRLLLADDNEGTWTIPFDNRADRAVIVVSALAPVTTEAATYEYSLKE